MGEPVRTSSKGWFWVAGFFGPGVIIGLCAALAAIDKGAPLAVAVFYGAYAGTFGAWAVFFFGIHFWRWIKRAQVPQFSLKRMLASATLIAIGCGISGSAYHLLGGRPTRMVDAVGFSLLFLGCILIGAGAFCPFHRTARGALTGFIISFLCFLPW